VYPRGAPRSGIPNAFAKAYPFSATGRLLIPKFGELKVCTATVVGPRHIITASQCALWQNYQDNSQPGAPMTFEPGFSMGRNYDPSNVVHSLWIKKIDPNNGGYADTGGDWLVGILDRDMKSTNGIFGQQLYNERWNGQNRWSMLGYPDNSGGPELSLLRPLAVTNVIDAEYGQIYELEGPTYEGEQGGPIHGMFGFSPRIIAVNHGAKGDFTIVAHGGLAMFDLIDKAISDWP
jgi:hypothetical protein